MKKLTLILATVLCTIPVISQVDFSLYLDKKALREKSTGIFFNFKDNGSIECITGNCKSGKGVLHIKNNGEFHMYIIGNFEDKKLNGEATILYINSDRHKKGYVSFEYDKLNADLKNKMYAITSIDKVYPYYQKMNDEVHEAYWGTFNNNILVDGLYSFNGSLKDLHRRCCDLFLTHFYHVKENEILKGKRDYPEDKNFTYRYKGEFKPSIGEGKAACSIYRDDDYIEIIPSWTNDIIVRKHPIPNYFEVTYYSKRGEILDEVLSHNNLFGAIGWQKEFKNGSTQPLVTIETKSNPFILKQPIEYVGIVPAIGRPFYGGTFYGLMQSGKPMK
ncbi:MAG: hypothetical protein R2825_24985 [Saprospiraceae bacterium]